MSPVNFKDFQNSLYGLKMFCVLTVSHLVSHVPPRKPSDNVTAPQSNSIPSGFSAALLQAHSYSCIKTGRGTAVHSRFIDTAASRWAGAPQCTASPFIQLHPDGLGHCSAQQGHSYSCIQMGRGTAVSGLVLLIHPAVPGSPDSARLASLQHHTPRMKFQRAAS